MEQGGGERVKIIEWVSLVVDVGGCSHFAGFIASMLVFLEARSLRSLTLIASRTCSRFPGDDLLVATSKSSKILTIIDMNESEETVGVDL